MAALIVSALLGVGLYAAPDMLGYEGIARVSHLIVGPIVASVSLIAISDVARELRWVNLLLGAWLVFSAVVIEHSQLALFTGVAIGMALAALSIVRGSINQRLGGGWRAVLRPPTDNTTSQGGTDERES
jgi:hypothetical protein